MLCFFLPAARHVIQRHWLLDMTPLTQEWVQEMTRFYRMEELMALLSDRSKAFWDIWTAWAMFMIIGKRCCELWGRHWGWGGSRWGPDRVPSLSYFPFCSFSCFHDLFSLPPRPDVKVRELSGQAVGLPLVVTWTLWANHTWSNVTELLAYTPVLSYCFCSSRLVFIGALSEPGAQVCPFFLFVLFFWLAIPMNLCLYRWP